MSHSQQVGAWAISDAICMGKGGHMVAYICNSALKITVLEWRQTTQRRVWHALRQKRLHAGAGPAYEHDAERDSLNFGISNTRLCETDACVLSPLSPGTVVVDPANPPTKLYFVAEGEAKLVRYGRAQIEACTLSCVFNA